MKTETQSRRTIFEEKNTACLTPHHCLSVSFLCICVQDKYPTTKEKL